MRFGNTLRASVYLPYKEHYLDYAKLKHLLREDAASQGDDRPWTADDESKFSDEILNVQLDKVASFQAEQFKALEERTNKAAEKLQELAPEEGKPKGDITAGRFKEIEVELDAIINEARELRKYSSINYTGFQKIVKKHDRKRGNNYKLRPILQNRLSERPFNSEHGYSALDNKISMLFFVVRQQLEEGSDPTAGQFSDSQYQHGDKYTAHKFWVHPDNLLEAKTFILRRLPALVYSDQSSKGLEPQGDPTLNSLYFDNAQFSLYDRKRNGEVDASSLRVRWYGQLNDKPELVIEQKIIHENGVSEEKKIPIKEKYVKAFIDGEYKMEKSVQKMERQGQPTATVEEFKKTAADIQKFILENNLQPILRANYTRTAFQKPADNNVRISIDTNLAFIREDSLDQDRPCRDPESWHRKDVDNSSMVYPFPNVNQGEISRFPFAVLEIKVKDDASKKPPQWVQDLMASHLVYEAPGFSKFLQGAVSLFEDNVNDYPSWHGNLSDDIRRDPQKAFMEDQERKAKQAENELVVGSFLGSKPSTSFKAAVSSPLAKSYMQERLAADEQATRHAKQNGAGTNGDNGDGEGESSTESGYGTISSIFPSFSLSRYAQSRRERNVKLPAGVTKPSQLLKDSGPVKVEPKVWMANERTFLKWQHICILMGTLAITLYTAAGEDTLAEFMGIVYMAIAIFTGGWGLYMQQTRRTMINARSGKDFDNVVGPLIVSFALMVALILNFIFQYRAALDRHNSIGGHVSNVTMQQYEESYKIELR